MKGYQITLTTHAVVYNVATLIRAIDPTFIDRGETFLQADPGNSSSAKVWIGDSNVSSSRYGWQLGAGDGSPSFPTLLGVYLTSDTDAQLINVLVVR